MIVGEIFLQSIPNQTFPLILDGNNYVVTIRTFRDRTYMSITINDKKICDNMRCFSNDVVYPYNDNTKIMFCWLCQDMEDPYYTKFGTLHKLLYVGE